MSASLIDQVRAADEDIACCNTSLHEVLFPQWKIVCANKVLYQASNVTVVSAGAYLLDMICAGSSPIREAGCAFQSHHTKLPCRL
jgi:hypothetical protein